MYKLKRGVQAFDVVDGPFAGRKFVPGKEYAEVPPQEKHKFDIVSVSAESKPAPISAVEKGAASSAKITQQLGQKDAVKLTTQATPKGYAGLKKEGTNEIIPSDTQPAGGLSQ